MRAFRLIIALLLAASLTILPVSAAMAMPHAADSEMAMSASGSDCPCCDAAKKCATDICMLKCYNAPAISAEGLARVEPLPAPIDVIDGATLSPFWPRPDPPPPRS